MAVKGTKKTNDDPLVAALNTRQLRFCEEYLKSNNATDAYIKAGYKVTTNASARACASILLTNANVENYIARERKITIKQSSLDRGMIIERLIKIAMGDIKEEVVTKAQMGEDEKGRPIYEAVVVEKKPSARDQKEALVYLNEYITKADMAFANNTRSNTIDRMILQAIKGQKVPELEAEMAKQTEYEEDNEEDTDAKE